METRENIFKKSGASPHTVLYVYLNCCLV